MDYPLPRTLPARPTRAASYRVDPGLVFVLLGLLLPGMLLTALYTGDWLLVAPLPAALRPYQSLIDPFVHLAVGLVVTAPLVLRERSAAGRLALLGLTVCAAVLIDLDHVLAAGSFSLYAITHLAGRPPTHSILFAVLAGLAVGGVSRRSAWGWLVCLAVLSHVVRDASGGGTPYFAWPLPGSQVSMGAYYATEMLLYLGALLPALLRRPQAAPRRVASLPARG
jgi:hypothetical protein